MGGRRAASCIHWPSDNVMNVPMPAVTVLDVRQAAATFLAGTGLGWDKLHPRAVARCSDESVLPLVRIFILAEMIGQWPDLVGIILICLLPKLDGGRRPLDSCYR